MLTDQPNHPPNQSPAAGCSGEKLPERYVALLPIIEDRSRPAAERVAAADAALEAAADAGELDASEIDVYLMAIPALIEELSPDWSHPPPIPGLAELIRVVWIILT